jgi:hypothetical protein
MKYPFNDWLPDVAADPIFIDSAPAGLGEEARRNMWAFSISSEQAEAVSAPAVVEFVMEVARARSKQLSDLPLGPHATAFYCWFDEQACQLRFSLVSASHGQLPFGATVKLVEDLCHLADRFVRSDYHDGIPWSEISDCSDEDEKPQSVNEYVVEVWTITVPL